MTGAREEKDKYRGPTARARLPNGPVDKPEGGLVLTVEEEEAPRDPGVLWELKQPELEPEPAPAAKGVVPATAVAAPGEEEPALLACSADTHEGNRRKAENLGHGFFGGTRCT